MPELRIIFTGLCAAGPPGPKAGAGERTADGPYQVVMPASRPRTSKRDPLYTIPVHLPFLAARTADVAAAYDPHRRLESLELRNRREEPYYVWLFSREHLTFSIVGADWDVGRISFVQTDTRPVQAPVVDHTERDVNWIPDMRLIWPDVDTLRKECLPPGKDPNVAMQVTLNSGVVSSRFPFDIARSERFSHFEPVKAELVEHVITRQTQFTVKLPINAQKLRIHSRLIDNDLKLADIELDIPPVAGLEIYIGNTDLQDLINTVSGNLTDNEYDFDADFELYYDILGLPLQQAPSEGRSRKEAATAPPSPALPIPISDPEHGGHADCPTLRVNLPGGGS